jgi:hypothetical protein
MLVGLVFYFINNELRFEKTLWVYLVGLGSGIILSIWIFAVRISSSSAFAPFSILIGEDHALRYVEIIVITIHLLPVIPVMLTKHYDLITEVVFLWIIVGQIVLTFAVKTEKNRPLAFIEPLCRFLICCKLT